MKKPVFICENKCAGQLRDNRAADQRFLASKIVHLLWACGLYITNKLLLLYQTNTTISIPLLP